MVLLNINAIEDAGSQEFPSLPDGWYSSVITASEVRTGKDSGRDYLSLEFTITSGDYTSRKVWMVYALWNEREDVVKWAQEKLGRLATALGWQQIENHEELEEQRVEIKTGPNKKGDTEVKYYRAAGITPPTPPGSNGKAKPAWA